MTLGLVITAIVAAWVSASPTMLRLIYSNWWVPHRADGRADRAGRSR